MHYMFARKIKISVSLSLSRHSKEATDAEKQSADTRYGWLHLQRVGTYTRTLLDLDGPS